MKTFSWVICVVSVFLVGCAERRSGLIVRDPVLAEGSREPHEAKEEAVKRQQDREVEEQAEETQRALSEKGLLAGEERVVVFLQREDLTLLAMEVNYWLNMRKGNLEDGGKRITITRVIPVSVGSVAHVMVWYKYRNEEK